MAAAPSDGGDSDADTGWLSDDTASEAEDVGERRVSSGAASSSGVEQRPPPRPPDEDEPTLEYRRLGACVSSLLEEDVASCATARDDLFALGTKSGRVHVFSHAGDFCSRLRRLSSARRERAPTHAAPVTGVAFDAHGEHVASCAADGTVSVARLGRRSRRFSSGQNRRRDESSFSSLGAKNDAAANETKTVFVGEYDSAALAVALDPRESDGFRRQMVVGLADGRLVVETFVSDAGREADSPPFVGGRPGGGDARDVIFEARGEGPVRAVAWAGPCVAWANDRGVKIYDIAARTPVAFIDRPRGSPPPERYPPRLVWDENATLLVGWADCVKVIAVSLRRDWVRRAEILEQFQTEYVVAGIAPHGEDKLLVLAFLETGANESASASDGGDGRMSRRRVSRRPEMRVVRRGSAGAVEYSRDALGVDGYDAFRPEEYALVRFGNVTETNGNVPSGSSAPRLAYLLASPKALVAARARTRADRIAWFSSRGDFDAALELCDEDEREKTDTENTDTRMSSQRDAVVTAYVEHLLRECAKKSGGGDADAEAKREALCRLCPRLFRGDARLWEKWLFLFARNSEGDASGNPSGRLLATIAPYVPTANPALRPEAYELILHAFLASPRDHARFLATVKAWPGSLYGVAGIISAARRAVFDALTESETPNTVATLREALAELYLLDGQRERALAAHIALGRPSVLDFVARHDLLGDLLAASSCLQNAVAPLALLDPHKAVALFVDRRDVAPPTLVAEHLRRAAEDTDTPSGTPETPEDDTTDFSTGPGEKSFTTPTRLRARETYHLYLRRLFAADPSFYLKPTHRDAQTALFAEFHPEELGAFLRQAEGLDLQRALRVVEAREAEARRAAEDAEASVSEETERSKSSPSYDVSVFVGGQDDVVVSGVSVAQSAGSFWRRRQALFASERASLLSRLGATRAALRALVDAGDIARAAALTHERAAPDPLDPLDEGDDELWDDLIELVTERAKGEMATDLPGSRRSEVRDGDVGDAGDGRGDDASKKKDVLRGIGELLDVAGAVIDPSRVLARVPAGAAIDGLRTRLVRVLAERRANARRERLAKEVSARFLARARNARLQAGRRAFHPARVVAED